MPQIPTDVLVIVGTAVAAILLLMAVFANLYRKAGPHEALIVYGFRGTRVIKGHGTVILPMVENVRGLSLELMSFDVAPQQDLYTKQGVAVTVEAVAQIKVKSDPESILTAAEQFLTKEPADREALIRLVMEGHLRGIIGQLTVEEIVKQPEMVADRMRSTCADDINKMGLEVISFTIKEVRDKNDYITNMGRPDIVRIKRDADVAAAEADRDTAIKRAIALRESAVAKAQADQERVAAETASMARQAEAQRDLDVKKATYNELVKRQQAQADKAYEIQTNVMQQQVIVESVKVQQAEKEQQVKVQEAEILRREKELIATVLKPAEIERQRIQTLAEADKSKTMVEAEGHASAIRAQGEAEAEIIFKKGDAEARAMNVKAEAYQEYNQAAVLDKLITGLPEVVKALASSVGQCRSDHSGLDRQRRFRGPEQNHRRPDSDRRTSAGAVRSAFGHEDVRLARQDQNDWRQGGSSGSATASGRNQQGEVAGARDNAGKEFVMALMDRVATLVRANLNDLIDKAENPEKMLKQVILDMENQFMQVKTQVAIALADLHLLEKKKAENNAKHAEWMRKAELAVNKKDDQLARAALERAVSFHVLAENYDQQIEDHHTQVESMKSALKRLELKLSEARAMADLLIVQHRRSRATHRAANAQHTSDTGNGAFERMRHKVAREEALGMATGEMLGDDLDVRLHMLEREQKINALLDEIKARKGLTA